MENKFIEHLNPPLDEWTIEYRVHATRRMFERDIDETDILFLFETGIVIEEYSEDYPFPSVLVNGRDRDGRPLHIVVGIDSQSRRLFLITTYEPDPKKWIDKFSRRTDQ
ncbi:DUF4258 domain-containing protein [bacterium]|nr:DUF4258 domain-containing protein [bacterium]